MNRKYIGVFDSGIGGLTAVKHLIEELPNENVVFLADTLNMPYGSKSKEQIIAYSLNDFDILNRYDLKALLIACNTADSAARKTLQKQTSIPVLGVIEAAARKACTVTENRKIGVLATPATVRSGKYEKAVHAIDTDIEVYSIACPELAPMIESGRNAEDPEVTEILMGYLKQLKDRQIDTLVLGCTHYDVLEKKAKELLPNIHVISSSACAIDDLKELLIRQDLLNADPEPERIYLVTADPEKFKKTASAILKNIEIDEA
ncbi:MAG: glutamate racemase [Erysipelotrichaceae bacterium]|nr:glutamate racemase [Erysipelotrichaceae bacterium]